MVGHLRQEVAEALEARQVVDRDQVIDERVRRRHATGEWLVVLGTR
jgi:hypothetical protein